MLWTSLISHDTDRKLYITDEFIDVGSHVTGFVQCDISTQTLTFHSAETGLQSAHCTQTNTAHTPCWGRPSPHEACVHSAWPEKWWPHQKSCCPPTELSKWALPDHSYRQRDYQTRFHSDKVIWDVTHGKEHVTFLSTHHVSGGWLCTTWMTRPGRNKGVEAERAMLRSLGCSHWREIEGVTPWETGSSSSDGSSDFGIHFVPPTMIRHWWKPPRRKGFKI